MKKNNYNIEHLIEQFYTLGFTNFMNQKEVREIKGRLHKKEYEIYNLFPDSSYVILYRKEHPLIHLVKIENSKNLKHQDIMGAIYSLGLKEGTFGDIIKYQEEFYVFLLPKIKEFLIQSLTEIKKNKIKLKEVDLSISQHFAIFYEKKK